MIDVGDGSLEASRMSAVSENGVAVVGAERFAEALARIRAVVGAEHILERRDQLEPRSRDTLPTVHAASAIVSPGSVDEVQAIVKIAQELKVPLWPVSRGRNWA